MKQRREIWGDDPSERDADRTVDELASVERVERRWQDHPAVVPFRAVVRFMLHNGKRIGITIAGFAVLLAGLALLVLPGPGWLLIFLGLGILATEYVWAQRLLRIAREKATQAKDAVLRKKPAATEEPDAPGGATGTAPGDTS
jgi:uncharacterized protein (TIGR02611 family)